MDRPFFIRILLLDFENGLTECIQRHFVKHDKMMSAYRKCIETGESGAWWFSFNIPESDTCEKQTLKQMKKH